MMNPDSDLIEDYLTHLAEIGRSAKTIRTYGTALRAAHRELPTGVPTAKHQEIAAWLAQYPSAYTRRTYLAAFRGFAAWAVIGKHISRNEVTHIRRPPEPTCLPNPCSDDELATILATARQPYRIWSTIAAYAGARVIEISRLHREHITVDRTQLHGKRDKLRRVPTHPLVWQAVRGLPPGPLVPGRDSDGDYLSLRLRQEYLRLGVNVTAHQLRHWYGTTLVANGATLDEVRDLMGHTNLRTTLGYVLVASPRLRAAVHRLPALT